jgi:hypothetical protein
VLRLVQKIHPGAALIVFPAKEHVKKYRTSSFRGAGTAREPGTHEH